MSRLRFASTRHRMPVVGVTVVLCASLTAIGCSTDDVGTSSNPISVPIVALAAERLDDGDIAIVLPKCAADQLEGLGITGATADDGLRATWATQP